MELFSQEYFERVVRHTVPSDAPETLIQKSAADMRNCVDMGFKDGLVSWFNGLWDSLFGNRSVNVDVNSSGTTGGRAGGLDYVPYNNYVANLHRGEMVLTADEADSYRRGKGSSNGFNLTQNIYAAKQTPVELAASTAAYFQRARWAL